MRFHLFFVASLAIASPALAGPDYSLVPGLDATGLPMGSPDGLQFDTGGLVLTNAPVADRSGGLHYLNFGMAYDHTDASGDIFYRPNDARYQLYVLDGRLGPVVPDPIVPTPIAEAVFSGLAELTSLGGGQYAFSADLLTFVPVGSPAPNGIGRIEFTFNADAPVGYQVTGGTLVVVTEPPSAVLMALAGLATVAGRRVVRFRRLSR
jgi:hypothetical protein